MLTMQIDFFTESPLSLPTQKARYLKIINIDYQNKEHN